MKNFLLVTVLFLFTSEAFSQYAGEPWTGTPWTFGTDTAANLSMGAITLDSTRRGPFNGIPHFLYDVGIVDTLARAGDDPNGELVAGSGYSPEEGPRTTYRIDAAARDSKTLDFSDLGAINSPNYGASYTTHKGNAKMYQGGGWYRYTCNFIAEGNYKLMMRMWGDENFEHVFWIRFYDKETMEPLYPWTRFHPGYPKKNDPTMVEGLDWVDVTQSPWDTIISGFDNLPNQTLWMTSLDEFTLNGEVVVEYSHAGPTSAYDDHAGEGNYKGNLGEISFLFSGDPSDNFAPVAEIWKEKYDNMEELNLTLTEAGTLYIVPNGTAEADLETANIDKMDMTTSDTYSKHIDELPEGDFQVVTKDAAGNVRYSAPIEWVPALVPDTLIGQTGDTINVNVTRNGFVAMYPKGDVYEDSTALINAFLAGEIDAAPVTIGDNEFVISNLSGDMNAVLVLWDEEAHLLSGPVDFQIGEGGAVNVIEIKKEIKVSVYTKHQDIVIDHNGNFEDLYIYDILGRKRIYNKVNAQHMSINAAELESGIYILRMNSRNHGVVTRKFFLNMD